MKSNESQTKLTSEHGSEFLFFEQEDKTVEHCEKCDFNDDEMEFCKDIPCAYFNRTDGKDGYFKLKTQ